MLMPAGMSWDDGILYYLLVFFRVLAFSGSVPLLGSDWVPKKVKCGFAGVCTWWLVQTSLEIPQEKPDFSNFYWVYCIAQEIFFGGFLGFTAQILFQVIIAAGELIAFQGSLAFASVVDTHSHFNIPVLSELYQLLFFLFYLALNGHIFLIQILQESLQVFPPAGAVIPLETYQGIFAWFAWIIKGGVLAVIPIVFSLLLVNIAMGVLSKSVPQINIISIGFPIYISALLVLLVLTAPFLSDFFMEMSELLRQQYPFLRVEPLR